jgi:hypothetical protein
MSIISKKVDLELCNLHRKEQQYYMQTTIAAAYSDYAAQLQSYISFNPYFQKAEIEIKAHHP